jgi:hypothetical protein
MPATHAAEREFTGAREMFWRHGLSAGNSGQPAIEADPAGAGAAGGVVWCVDVCFGGGALSCGDLLTDRVGATVECTVFSCWAQLRQLDTLRDRTPANAVIAPALSLRHRYTLRDGHQVEYGPGGSVIAERGPRPGFR